MAPLDLNEFLTFESLKFNTIFDYPNCGLQDNAEIYKN